MSAQNYLADSDHEFINRLVVWLCQNGDNVPCCSYNVIICMDKFKEKMKKCLFVFLGS